MEETPPQPQKTVTEKAVQAAETTKKVVDTGKKIGAATSTTVGALTSPTTWVVLGVVLLILVGLVGGVPAMQVWGKTRTLTDATASHKAAVEANPDSNTVTTQKKMSKT